MPKELQAQFHGLSAPQRTMVLRFAQAIQVLLALHDRLTTAQALTFLAAWSEEGLSVSALAHRCGFKPVLVSRHLSQLSYRIINDEHRGLDLLEVTDRQTRCDFRLRHVFLTERGQLLAKHMVEFLQAHPRKLIGTLGAMNVRDFPPMVSQ